MNGFIDDEESEGHWIGNLLEREREREKMRASDEDPFLEEYSRSEHAYPPAAFFLSCCWSYAGSSSTIRIIYQGFYSLLREIMYIICPGIQAEIRLHETEHDCLLTKHHQSCNLTLRSRSLSL